MRSARGTSEVTLKARMTVRLRDMVHNDHEESSTRKERE